MLDKTCNQFLIHFFAISRRYHLKWLSSYVNHISGYVLTLKETMSCPLFPDSYPFGSVSGSGTGPGDPGSRGPALPDPETFPYEWLGVRQYISMPCVSCL